MDVLAYQTAESLKRNAIPIDLLNEVIHELKKYKSLLRFIGRKTWADTIMQLDTLLTQLIDAQKSNK